MRCCYGGEEQLVAGIYLAVEIGDIPQALLCLFLNRVQQNRLYQRLNGDATSEAAVTEIEISAMKGDCQYYTVLISIRWHR